MLLSETRNHHQKLYLYEPNSFKPLCFIENNQAYFYHNDHLGTPQELTDWEGRVVWSARYRAYGNVVRQDVALVENNIRAQGQYYDQELGLHYNRHRYYDPATGQFTNQDPVGLLGGTNLYQFAPNPINWVDPLGLTAKCDTAKALEDPVTENKAVQDAKRVDDPDLAQEISQVPQYDTPYNPLTPKQKRELKKKLEARTLTQDEYDHLMWDRRFDNRRKRGVNRFWSEERQRLLNGDAPTRNWTDEQRKQIIEYNTTKKAPTFNGDPIEGHHTYNALNHPQLADDPSIIYPATKNEHFNRWHGGNWQNDTFGKPLDPEFPEEF